MTQWILEALELSDSHPVLIDRFLQDAIEVDVDAISDGHETVVGGLMEHIEEAGIHSGDSACSLPASTLRTTITDRIRTYTRELALRLQVKGLMNLQFAVQNEQVYLLEINPRASRTVPFVSKATGVPLAKLAAQVIMGKSLRDLGIHHDLDLMLNRFCVKVPVFPFDRFPNLDVILGPEMKSTGEAMGIDQTFAGAFAKAMRAVGISPPQKGRVFLSIRDEDKAAMLPIAAGLHDLGFELHATEGTALFLNRFDLYATRINKLQEGEPHCVDAIRKGFFVFVINTTSDGKAIRDSFDIRRVSLETKIPYCTVISSARAMLDAIRAERSGLPSVMSL